MINTLPSELILKVASYCSRIDIINFSFVCKIVAKLKLYRLCISNIVCYGFIGKHSYIDLQNELNDFIEHYHYTFDEYIKDIYNILFTIEYRCKCKKQLYNYKYKHSYKIKQIIQNDYKLTKNNANDENILKCYNRCHGVYRINIFTYRLLRKNTGLSILALIY